MSNTPLLSDVQARLLRCLADGRFCSGNDLAQQLGLTRAAVWKQIHALQNLGLTVHSVAGKGYRLSAPLELLDRAAICDSLSADALRHISELQLHDVLDSSNAHLLRLRTTQTDAIVCLAEMQSAGRGRSGRQWISPFAASIYLSVLWRFTEGTAALGGLSLAVGVAAVRALRCCGVGDVALKWPNDLLWRGRKLGGVLIEVVGESHGLCRAVVGLGINGAVPAQAGASIDQSWVDLAEICNGLAPSRNRLIAALIEELIKLLGGYAETGLKAYLPEWRQLNCVLDQPVVMHMADRSDIGIARDVTEEGLLLLELPDGTRKPYAAGEVRLRLGAG